MRKNNSSIRKKQTKKARRNIFGALHYKNKIFVFTAIGWSLLGRYESKADQWSEAMSSWVWDPKLSLYGAVSAEGGEAPEGGPGQPVHLGDVQVLQRGAGGGEGKEAGLTNVVAASDGELAKTKKGPTKGGQAWVGNWALAQVQRAQSAAAGRQAGQAEKRIFWSCHIWGTS